MDIIRNPNQQKTAKHFAQTSRQMKTKPISPSQLRSEQQSKSKQNNLIKRVLFGVITAFVVLVVGVSVYLGAKVYTTSKTVTIAQNPVSNAQFISAQNANIDTASNKQPIKTTPSFASDTLRAATSLVTNKRTPLDGESAGRINILLLGKGNELHPGKNLTDTLMIASINTETKKIALLSLPRDLYVRTPGTNVPRKINSLYQYGLTNDLGVGPIIGAIQNLTNLRIHYFLLADFDAFIAVVDALGGINVEVLRDINDTLYPGPNYSYQTFTIKKGLHKMDGKTALKYVRSRHGDPEGDFGRAKRQQQVLQAIKNKAFSLGTFANPLTMSKLLDAISDNVRTDMSLADMTSLMSLTKNLDTQNITTVVVDAWKSNSLLRVSNFGKAFGLVPRAGKYNYNEINELADTIFDRDAQLRQLRKIATETPRINIVSIGANSKTLATVRATIAEALRVSIAHISTTKINPKTSAQITPNTIVDHTNSTKLFTIDALHKLLNMPITTTLAANSSDATTQQNSDITIYLDKSANDTFAITDITREEFEKAE